MVRALHGYLARCRVHVADKCFDLTRHALDGRVVVTAMDIQERHCKAIKGKSDRMGCL